MQEQYNRAKQTLLNFFNADNEQWENWHWQMANRIKEVKVISQLIDLSPAEKEAIEKVGRQYRWAVSAHYLALAVVSVPGALFGYR